MLYPVGQLFLVHSVARASLLQVLRADGDWMVLGGSQVLLITEGWWVPNALRLNELLAFMELKSVEVPG